MKCEICETLFTRREVKRVKVKALNYELECPNCHRTLVQDRKSLTLQLVGGLLTIIGMVVILDWVKVESFAFYALAGFLVLFGGLLSISGIYTSKQIAKT